VVLALLPATEYLRRWARGRGVARGRGRGRGRAGARARGGSGGGSGRLVLQHHPHRCWCRCSVLAACTRRWCGCCMSTHRMLLLALPSTRAGAIEVGGVVVVGLLECHHRQRCRARYSERPWHRRYWRRYWRRNWWRCRWQCCCDGRPLRSLTSDAGVVVEVNGVEGSVGSH